MVASGSDTRIITESEQRVDLSGIDSHEICNIKLGNAGAVVRTQHGDVIVIMNNYALVSEHKTIHSSAQIESYKNKVDDRALFLGEQLASPRSKTTKYPCISRTDSHTLRCDLSQMNFVTYLMYSLTSEGHL
jgi:hypothetical protein